MPLTDVQIRTAKPGLRPVKASGKSLRSQKEGKTKGKPAGRKVKPSETSGAPHFIATEKPYKMAHGGGLYLEVDPSGGKYWRSSTDVPEKRNGFHLACIPR
jgi:hypothetical protein